MNHFRLRSSLQLCCSCLVAKTELGVALGKPPPDTSSFCPSSSSGWPLPPRRPDFAVSFFSPSPLLCEMRRKRRFPAPTCPCQCGYLKNAAKAGALVLSNLALGALPGPLGGFPLADLAPTLSSPPPFSSKPDYLPHGSSLFAVFLSTFQRRRSSLQHFQDLVLRL